MTRPASTAKRVVTALVVALVATATLTGCSSQNNGGKTTCGEYRAMSSSKQTAVVTKMLQDEGQSTANGLITLTKLSVSAYCATLGSDSSTIDQING